MLPYPSWLITLYNKPTPPLPPTENYLFVVNSALYTASPANKGRGSIAYGLIRMRCMVTKKMKIVLRSGERIFSRTTASATSFPQDQSNSISDTYTRIATPSCSPFHSFLKITFPKGCCFLTRWVWPYSQWVGWPGKLAKTLSNSCLR